VLAEVATEQHRLGECELIAGFLEKLRRVVLTPVIDKDDLEVSREVVVSEVATKHPRHLEAEVARERPVVVDRDDERIEHAVGHDGPKQVLSAFRDMFNRNTSERRSHVTL